MGNTQLEEDRDKAEQKLNDDQVTADKANVAVQKEEVKDAEEKTDADQKKAASD